MPGGRHQFILGLVVRQMRESGFRVFCVDGRFVGKLGEEVRIPPRILHHRPDALGLSLGGVLCIGEAKTESDIGTRRTRRQIQDFVGLDFNDQACQVILGVPRTSEEAVKRLLAQLDIAGSPNLHVLYVPEEIINE